MWIWNSASNAYFTNAFDFVESIQNWTYENTTNEQEMRGYWKSIFCISIRKSSKMFFHILCDMLKIQIGNNSWKNTSE